MTMQKSGHDPMVDSQILETMDRFIQDWVEPRSASMGVTNEYPRELHAEAARLGLFGLVVPQAYGGVEVSVRARLAIIECTARSSGAFAVILCTWPDGLEPLSTVGSDELKRKYLPSVASGELISAIAMATTMSSMAPKPGAPWAGWAMLSRYLQKPIRK